MHERDTGRASRLCELTYGLLLAAYPRPFRDAYGEQITQAFKDLVREERQKGGSAWLVRLWRRVLPDLAASAIVQRINYLNRTSKEKEAVLSKTRLAVLSIVFVLAPLLFATASVLKYGVGVGILLDPLETWLADPERLHWFNQVSPVVFLGSLALALALNVYAVLRFSFDREVEALVVTVRPGMKRANIAMAAISLSLLIGLVWYGLQGI